MSTASVASVTSSSVASDSGVDVGVDVVVGAGGDEAPAGLDGTINNDTNSNSNSNTNENEHDNAFGDNPNNRHHHRMETALDVLTRALQGDGGARSFLDQSCSIYVLDVSCGIQHAKLFGAWHVLHQALNEIERATARAVLAQKSQIMNRNMNSNIAVDDGDGGDHYSHGDKPSDEDNNDDDHNAQDLSSRVLLPQTQLLAHMALRVARRSSAMDQQLVVTCIDNSAHQSESIGDPANVDAVNTNNNELQRVKAALIQANAELREMVVGRIAAFAFDGCSTQGVSISPFADHVVVETLTKVVAANAVSNGPSAVKHCLLDWLIPSRDTMPHYALICVVLNFALEAASFSTPAPAKTRDALQQSSIAVVTQVVGPVLQAAMTDHVTYKNKKEMQIEKSRIAAKALLAIQAWSKITDLSLAQVKHVCAKARINVSDVLSEAMHSESPLVLEALADLLEAAVDRHDHRDNIAMKTSALAAASSSLSSSSSTSTASRFNIHTVWTSQKARMAQTRYIMQVDEEAFRSSGITYSQLHQIESKELGILLDVLATTVTLQSFRLIHSPTGDSPRHHDSLTPNEECRQVGAGNECIDTTATRQHSCSRSLARIAAAICFGISADDLNTSNVAIGNRRWIIPGPKMLDLLLKCASHPSVVVCANILPVMTPVLAQQVGLATQWLPILQRRAIIPHHHSVEYTGHINSISLDAADICQVTYDDFVHRFRDTVLADALLACFQSHPEFYLASCTAAIEEFCSVGQDTATLQTSFHLEAALFVMASAADGVSDDSPGTSNEVIWERISGYLERCTAALAKIPQSLTSNPLAMVAACRFITKFGRWYCANKPDGILDVASSICLYTFNLCGSAFPDKLISVVVEQDCGVTPYGEAARSLSYLLSQNPSHFLSNKAIGDLGAAWEASFAACNHTRKLLTTDDRMAICSGICHVLSRLPERQRATSVMALAMPSIGCLEAMVQHIEATVDVDRRNAALDRVAAEIVIVSTIARSFSNAVWSSEDDLLKLYPPIADPALTILRRAWPSIQEVASTYIWNESILDSLGYLMKECLPPDIDNQASMGLLQELCTIATIIVRKGDVRWRNGLIFVPVFNFADAFVKNHGNVVDEASRAIHEGRTASDRQCEVHRLLQSIVMAAAAIIEDHPGSVWAQGQRQGNGQPAFETKTKPAAKVDSTVPMSNAGLASLFTFLTSCMEHCPHFLIRMTVGPSTDDDDLLVRRTLELAVSSLLDFDADTSVQAMLFLGAVLVPTDHNESRTLPENTNADDPTRDNNDIYQQQHRIKELCLRVKPAVSRVLLKGFCGKFPFDTLHVASRLLYNLCQVPGESSPHNLNKSEAIRRWGTVLQQGLVGDHYLLGDAIRGVVIEFCAGVMLTNPTIGLDLIDELFEGMWQLHHLSDNSVRPLASSDLALLFHDAYRPEKR